MQRLLWIPGIGRLLAFTLWLEIDGIGRFPSARDFGSYCRLVPGAGNSGGKVRHKRTKDGNRYLELAFHHAAVRAIQYCPEVRAWAQALRRRTPAPVARHSWRRSSRGSSSTCCTSRSRSTARSRGSR